MTWQFQRFLDLVLAKIYYYPLFWSTSSFIQEADPDGRRNLWKNYKTLGLEDEVIKTRIAACNDKTFSQYYTYWLRWIRFCNQKNVSYKECNLVHILSFLHSLYKQNLGYQAINTARSALSLHLGRIGGVTVGNHELCTRFMRGILRLRPSAPRYSVIWDPSVVHDKLSQLDDNFNLSLKQLFLKPVTSLMLITCSRVQTISCLYRYY